MFGKEPPPSKFLVATNRLKLDLEVHRGWMATKRTFLPMLERTRKIKRTRTGRQLLIVANGPRSEELSPKFLQNFAKFGGEVMGLNWAHLNPALKGVPLDLYLSADRRMVEDTEKSHDLRRFLASQENLVAFVPEIRLRTWETVLPEVLFIPFCRFYIKYFRPPWWKMSPMHPKAFTGPVQ